MSNKQYKFEVGEQVLNRHGLLVTIDERKVDKRYGHNLYYLKEDSLKVAYTESHFKKVGN